MTIGAHPTVQVDCESPGFEVLELVSVLAVCLYPIGIPVATLALLLRNSKAIREGGPSHGR
jgi:hypothetical protein